MVKEEERRRGEKMQEEKRRSENKNAKERRGVKGK